MYTCVAFVPSFRVVIVVTHASVKTSLQTDKSKSQSSPSRASSLRDEHLSDRYTGYRRCHLIDHFLLIFLQGFCNSSRDRHECIKRCFIFWEPAAVKPTSCLSPTRGSQQLLIQPCRTKTSRYAVHIISHNAVCLIHN